MHGRINAFLYEVLRFVVVGKGLHIPLTSSLNQRPNNITQVHT